MQGRAPARRRRAKRSAERNGEGYFVWWLSFPVLAIGQTLLVNTVVGRTLWDGNQYASISAISVVPNWNTALTQNCVIWGEPKTSSYDISPTK
jgi:hypothetical protein